MAVHDDESIQVEPQTRRSGASARTDGRGFKFQYSPFAFIHSDIAQAPIYADLPFLVRFRPKVRLPAKLSLPVP